MKKLDLDNAEYNKKKIELWAPMFVIVYGTMAIFQSFGFGDNAFTLWFLFGLFMGIGLNKIYNVKLRKENL